MKNRLRVFLDIGELLTLKGAEEKSGRQVQESDLSILRDAIMVSENGKVVWIGEKKDFSVARLKPWGGEGIAEFKSLGGGTVLPAFSECHTHLVFAGNRAEEFEWRVQGQTYQEISAKGGGILSTVRATRNAPFDQLASSAQKRVDQFVRQGVTTLEIKSGYGLDEDTETKCLRVARSLTGPRIVTTYLGAHSRSPDFDDLDSYLEYLYQRVLPRVTREKLADRIDIYIEKGFYDLDQARAYFMRAKELGLSIVAHVDQLSDLGGTNLALEMGAVSVDHVVHIGDATIDRLSQSEATAVLLPTSDLYLRMAYPKARQLIDRGARVALSTDYNPGTSPTQDLSLVGVLARLEMRMSLPEVIAAYTIGAAYALSKGQEVGSLTLGKSCDFTVLDGSWKDLFYSVGHHPVKSVYRSGDVIWSAQ